MRIARLSHKTLSEFFNTAAFAPQPLGTVGNTQRNSLFGPDFRHVDLSLFKTFPVTERVNVQFRIECFNISNTPNFYMANTNSLERAVWQRGLRTDLADRSELHPTAVPVRAQGAVLTNMYKLAGGGETLSPPLFVAPGPDKRRPPGHAGLPVGNRSALG